MEHEMTKKDQAPPPCPLPLSEPTICTITDLLRVWGVSTTVGRGATFPLPDGTNSTTQPLSASFLLYDVLSESVLEHLGPSNRHGHHCIAKCGGLIACTHDRSSVCGDQGHPNDDACRVYTLSSPLSVKRNVSRMPQRGETLRVCGSCSVWTKEG